MMCSSNVRSVLGAECLLTLLLTCGIQAQPQLERGPQDAVVREGDTVTFVCDLTYVDFSYYIYWLEGSGHSLRYLSDYRSVRTSPPLPELERRLSIIGDESKYEFNLRITNVQVTDEGTYSCQFRLSGGDNQAETVGTAELTVLVPPSPQSPLCSVQPESGAVGDDVTLYCYSQGGEPTPNISYYKESEALVGPATNSISHKHQLEAKDNGVIFTCIMTTPALDEPRNCSVMPLRILPNATILPAVSRVGEGTASFQCNGEGLPHIRNYRWKVIDAGTGYILPAERYTVSENGQTLEIAVMENLELVCIVSVPSGLTGNSTKTVEVYTRRLPTTAITNPVNGNPGSTGESSLSPIVPIAIAAVILAVVVLVIIFVWRRKQKRKPGIPVDESKMRNMEGKRDELSPGQGGRASSGSLSHEDGSQGSTNGPNAISGAAPHSKPVTPASANGRAVRSPVEPTAAGPQDIPLYAQLDKPTNDRKSEDVTGGSEYSTVPMEEPAAVPAGTDFGLVYADLDLQSPATAPMDTGPASASEATVYAMIRT